MFGFLNVDKPKGLTSRDVVNQVQRLVRPHKVGHAGTLDPLATGVLVIAVGPATRLIQYVQQARKQYDGEFWLGRISDTEDFEGEVAIVPVETPPTPAQVLQVLKQFRGEQMQRPPAYSALKVAGKRAYKLARRGEKVELAERPITIYDLRLRRYEFPVFEIAIECSAGTYIRSLGRDIGQALAAPAVMSALQRTAVGPFSVDQAIPFSAFESANRDDVEQMLQPPLAGVSDLPTLTLSDAEVETIFYGQTLQRQPPPALQVNDPQVCAAVDEAGRLQAILSPREQSLQPIIGFAPYWRNVLS